MLCYPNCSMMSTILLSHVAARFRLNNLFNIVDNNVYVAVSQFPRGFAMYFGAARGQASFWNTANCINIHTFNVFLFRFPLVQISGCFEERIAVNLSLTQLCLRSGLGPGLVVMIIMKLKNVCGNRNNCAVMLR